jgi:hypothetical protein
MDAGVQEEVGEGQTGRISPASPTEKETKDQDVQFNFDTGMKAWLQVLGAFFLWFNSW